MNLPDLVGHFFNLGVADVLRICNDISPLMDVFSYVAQNLDPPVNRRTVTKWKNKEARIPTGEDGGPNREAQIVKLLERLDVDIPEVLTEVADVTRKRGEIFDKASPGGESITVEEAQEFRKEADEAQVALELAARTIERKAGLR